MLPQLRDVIDNNMEPVTHALTSIALGRAGLNKITRAATPMLLVSGLIADVDWVTRLGGAETFLRGHRTATHSLAGTAAIVAAVAAVSWFAGRKYPKYAVGIFPALAICAIGAGAHLLLDMLNGYGVKLLWPFSPKWYAWDLADSVDSWILFFLLAGLLLPELFRLVLEEIGSRPKRHGRQRGAIVGLIFVALVVAGRGFAHDRAIALLDSRDYRGQTPLQVAAFPRPSNPLLWSGVVETDNAIFNLEVPLGPGSRVRSGSRGHALQTGTIRDAKKCRCQFHRNRIFKFCKIPTRQRATPGRWLPGPPARHAFRVRIAGRRGVVAVIDLNAQSLVVGEHLQYDAAPGN